MKTVFLAGVIVSMVFVGSLLLAHDSEVDIVRPVVFVHGFGGDASEWTDLGYAGLAAADPTVYFKASLQQSSTGVTAMGWLPAMAETGNPCYAVSLTDNGMGDIRESASELGKMIEFVCKEEGVAQVSLVGFSLGGVVCREYVSSTNYDQRVCDLITVSSPHLGTELAMLRDVYTNVQAQVTAREAELQAHKPQTQAPTLGPGEELGDLLDRVMGEMAEVVRQGLKDGELMLLDEKKGAFKEWAEMLRGQDIDIDSVALDMLHVPADGNYLDELNARAHPTEIRYSCLVASKSVGSVSVADVDNLMRTVATGKAPTQSGLWSVASDLSRVMLTDASWFEFDYLAQAGDGVVSRESQNLRNVPWFKEHPEVPVRVLEVVSAHADHDLRGALVLLLLNQK